MARKRDSSTTAKFVALARESLGITQADMGDAIGVSRATIANYERGAIIPNGDIVFAIIKCLSEKHMARIIYQVI